MKVQKFEIARTIDRLKNVIVKGGSIPALEGILVKDRYYIGSNAELTVQIKSEACGPTDELIIPSRAFDLIRSLPDGEVEITSDESNVVTIRTGRTRNRYQSFSPDSYSFYQPKLADINSITLSGALLMDSFKNVVHAPDKKSIKPVLTGVFIEKSEVGVDIAGTDGHLLAWDRMPSSDNGSIKAIIPRTAVEKILTLGILDEVSITYDKSGIIFESDEYRVSSRLIDGEYPDFRKFFKMDMPIWANVDKKELAEAMNRAKLSMVDAAGNKKPAVLRILEDTMEISIASAIGDYKEDLPIESNIPEPFRIGLDPVIVLDSIKAFSDGPIRLKFMNSKSPVFMEQEETLFKTMVLPVAIDAKPAEKGEPNE